MEIRIRTALPEDTEPFIALLQEIRRGMENPDWFFLDPPGEVRNMLLSGKMELWVATDGPRLAGAFDIIFPGLDSYNYGYDLLFGREDLLRVVNMDTVAVHPDYRGLGLQKKLMQEAEAAVRKRGPHILLCTVHPDNLFSLNNFLDQGYSIQCRLPKYGSVRYLLRKDVP